ncbi:MAG TPA: hypothetical protein VKW06_16155 [Candidatus Angelobacter sp.]|nr:hypothetical protein [Candidatus Angelobacter sp.]
MDDEQLKALADGQWEKGGIFPPQNIAETINAHHLKIQAAILLRLISIEKLLKERGSER